MSVLYETLWDWKKELKNTNDSIVLHLNGEDTIEISCKDHISCISDVIFVSHNGHFFKYEWGIPVTSINYITLKTEKEDIV